MIIKIFNSGKNNSGRVSLYFESDKNIWFLIPTIGIYNIRKSQYRFCIEILCFTLTLLIEKEKFDENSFKNF